MKNIGIWLVMAVLGITFTNQIRTVVATRTNISESSSYLHVVHTTLLNAETAQRGYLLTGDEKYLEPFYKAQKTLPAAIYNVKSSVLLCGKIHEKLVEIENLGKLKMAELEDTIEHYQAGEPEKSLEIVKSGVGQAQMESIRILIKSIEDEQTREWYDLAAQLSELIFATTISLGIIVVWAVVTFLFEIWCLWLRHRTA